MSGREFTPDFDWLKRGIENRETPQQPATPPPANPLTPPDAAAEEPVTSESASSIPAEEATLADESAADSTTESPAASSSDPVIHDELPEVPPIDQSANDGTTLILKSDQLNQDGFRESAGNSGILFPTEQFTDPGTTLDVPIASDATDAELPVVSLPEALKDENEAEQTANDAHETAIPGETTISPDAANTDEATSPPLPGGEFEIPPPDENEPLSPIRPWPSSFSKTSESTHTAIERDTDVPQSAKTTEYPAGSSNWADFAAPAAAGAAAAGLAGLDRGSLSAHGKGAGDFMSGGSAEPPTSTKSGNGGGASNSGADRRRMILLGGYAAVVTLALLMFVLKDLTDWFRPHHLESLPDIPAEKVENLSYVPANMRLPKGHTLALGEKQRFGNILVEPLKITSEPIEFTHYSGDPKRKREQTAPVWKLWLKFTNVSEDQTIAPLDRRLVLRWVSKARQNWDFTNQYIAEQGAKSRNTPSLQLYRMPAQGDWDLKDQDLGHVLKPGESYVTYLASSDEGADELANQLVWRVQMRKGYSASGNGVTTLFEVPFRKDEVVSEAS